MYSSECRIREVTARMWRAAEDCSRSERQRLEKLGRRRLRVEYEEQTARETKRNADSFETPTLLDDEVHRRDMTVSGREDIYKQEQPAWSLSAKRSSATDSQCNHCILLFSKKITNRSFGYASPHRWNQLPVSRRVDRCPAADVTLFSSSSTFSPLTPSITR